MNYRVIKKQQNSKMCMVCGLKNPFGLKSAFYELENNELLAVFKPMEEHQSYPNLLHGGVSSAMLDETIGRAIMGTSSEIWGVTTELGVKFRKPVPLDQELRIRARITRNTSRLFEGSGELLLEDGTVAVEAYGKYMKMPLSKIADFDEEEQEWKVIPDPDDPETVSLP